MKLSLTSLDEILTSVDEKIWKQCEKVTNYTYKNIGYDQWDLAYITDTATIATEVGMGAYMAVEGLVNDKYSLPLRGYLVSMGGLIGVGWPVTFLSFYMNNTTMVRERELNTLTQTGASPLPCYSSLRPLILGAAAILAGGGVYSFQQEGVTLFEHLFGSISAFNSILLTSMVASNYFKSQLPRPPAPKKSLWAVIEKAVYERIPGRKPVAVTNP